MSFNPIVNQGITFEEALKWANDIKTHPPKDHLSGLFLVIIAILIVVSLMIIILFIVSVGNSSNQDTLTDSDDDSDDADDAEEISDDECTDTDQHQYYSTDMTHSEYEPTDMGTQSHRRSPGTESSITQDGPPSLLASIPVSGTKFQRQTSPIRSNGVPVGESKRRSSKRDVDPSKISVESNPVDVIMVSPSRATLPPEHPMIPENSVNPNVQHLSEQNYDKTSTETIPTQRCRSIVSRASRRIVSPGPGNNRS